MTLLFSLAVKKVRELHTGREVFPCEHLLPPDLPQGSVSILTTALAYVKLGLTLFSNLIGTRVKRWRRPPRVFLKGISTSLVQDGSAWPPKRESGFHNGFPGWRFKTGDVMNRKISLLQILLFLCLSLFVGPSFAAGETALDQSYLIGPNDVLNIHVWKEPELTQEVTVMTDGKISFPLIGEVMAQGQTVTQLKETIGEQLKKYVTNPEVTVIVRQSRSQWIYTIGKVARPGPYVLESGMTILQALSNAGGFLEWAGTKKVLIVRREGEKEVHIHFNYDDFVSGKNVRQNIFLKPDDTIVVP
jgi:polysaccharide biosynthesis/export protein